MRRLLILLLLIPLVNAATITGTIYDLELNEVSNVLIEIDTIPAQKLVSKSGSYLIEVPNGDYTLKASKDDLLTIETITIKDTGNYNLDLFLFEDLSSDEALLEEELTVNEDLNNIDPTPIWPIVVGFFLVIGFYLVLRSKQVKSNKDENVVLDILKKHGGRITQKDLRKEIPLSEAKVSLMIAELESEGKLKKIKKGRSNILILK